MHRQPENAALGYSDTPVLPDSGYHVHDGTRPQPPVVVPAANGGPPSDALVLFDGTSLEAWTHRDGRAAQWSIENGEMVIRPGTGDLHTRASFGALQLHLEFRCPTDLKGGHFDRGNSGIFLMERYEVQVIDSHENLLYADGAVGAVYGQYPPLANSIRPPGQWNTFDLLWTPPVFEGAAMRQAPVLTAWLNGVVQHHGLRLLGQTQHLERPLVEPHPAQAPLHLQEHGDPVAFRNIWARPIQDYDTA
ncbi:MAG: DUF1080 domain-containing protein [Opitutales bacterium]